MDTGRSLLNETQAFQHLLATHEYSPMALQSLKLHQVRKWYSTCHLANKCLALLLLAYALAGLLNHEQW